MAKKRFTYRQIHQKLLSMMRANYSKKNSERFYKIDRLFDELELEKRTRCKSVSGKW